MPETITVGVGFKVAPDVLEAIAGVDPRIRIVQVPELARTSHFRGMEPLAEAEAAELKARLQDVEVLFGQNSVGAEFLEAAPNLKWFQVINAGVERMAAGGLLEKGFVVTNASGLAAVPIAEYVLCTMLMLAKGIQTFVRNQSERRWDSRGFTDDLTGKTCGIAGMGAIGKETARLATAFGMRVLATRRTVESPGSDDVCDEILPYSMLDRLLTESDYVVLCVPLTTETRHMIGAAELQKMKPTAAIVNIARGAVIDQDALIQALKDGTIAGAALDVTDPEPLPAESELWGMENVILTPHISGAVKGYGHRAARIFVANLERYVRGQPLEHVVSPERGY